MARGRHWTAEEDSAIRESAARNWPGLDRLAVTFDRTHAAVRQRASRIKARRLAPAGSGGTHGPAVATERTCTYCGDKFESTGVRVHCGAICRELSRGLCPDAARTCTAV